MLSSRAVKQKSYGDAQFVVSKSHAYFAYRYPRHYAERWRAVCGCGVSTRVDDIVYGLTVGDVLEDRATVGVAAAAGRESAGPQ